MDIAIISSYDINPNDILDKRDVISPDFLTKYALLEQLTIYNGNLKIGTLGDNNFKVQIKSNDNKALDIFSESTTLMQLGNNHGKISIQALTELDKFFKLSYTKSSGTVTEFLNGYHYNGMDVLRINTPLWVDEIHVGEFHFGESETIQNQIDSTCINTLNDSKNYTDNSLMAFEDNILTPNYYTKLNIDDMINDPVIMRTNKTNLPTQSEEYNLGSPSWKWNTIYAITFDGMATTVAGADLAEKYTIKENPQIGHVIVISEDDNVDCEISKSAGDHKVLGVISENPGLKMNKELSDGKYIALKGRVKCLIQGPVKKGDPLISYMNGFGISIFNPCVGHTFANQGIIFGKALENQNSNQCELIEIIVL